MGLTVTSNRVSQRPLDSSATEYGGFGAASCLSERRLMSMASTGGSRTTTPELSARTACFVGAQPQSREKTIADAAASGNTFAGIPIGSAFLHQFHCTPGRAEQGISRTFLRAGSIMR